MKVAVPSQTVRVLRGGNAKARGSACGGEESKVPVFRDIPVEAVEGVEEDEEEPAMISMNTTPSFFEIDLP